MAKIIDRATEGMSNLLQLGEAMDEIQNEQERLQIFIGDVHNLLNAYQYQNVPKSLEIWLHKMEANDSCSNCLSGRKLSRRTLLWKRNTEKLLQQTAREIPLLLTVEQRLPSSAFRPVRLDRLVQPVPESGFVGTQIQRQESLLQNWLINDDRTRVMAVLGMGGVGKTSLLKKINNSEAVQKAFDHSAIWITVSQNRSINDLQNSMGRRIGIVLSESSSEDERAMALNTSLMNIQRFLLILDDVWTRIELAKLGVCRWAGGYGWKVVLSTRIEQVSRSMRADRTIKMKPLCEEESWALFSTGTFGDGQPVSQEIERIAKEVADECQGLPLALNVISAAMAKQTDRSQWDVALKHLKTVDDTICSIHQDIDRDLYKRLRLSYNALRDDLKLCFLYCGFYPEDKGIHVEELIKMWRAEGLVKSREPGNINEIGHAFLKVLIDRCLIEVECENSLTREVQYCRMHDVIRDMAIRISDEEKCLLRAGQNVKTFPLEVMDGCERISLMFNNIESLPDNFVCPSLLSLVLSWNKGIKAVPHGFLINLRSLKVLDLSHTGLRSLPSSVGRLKHLVYLGLMNTQIQQLPEDIGELGGLELLDLSYCHDLQYLPVRMGDLKCLKLLNLFSCYNLSFLPRGISQLSLLENLYIFQCEAVAEQMGLEHGPGENAACLNDLRNLTNLRTLQLNVQGSIPAGVMGNWAEMQDLALRLKGVLPEDMRSMEFLKSLILDLGDVTELPEWLGDFNNLQSLDLRGCCRLRDISAVGRLPRLSHLCLLLCAELRELGVRLWTAGSCPMLEELELWHLPSLQNLISPGTTVQEDSMPKLRTLRIVHCDNLKRLPMGLHKLKRIEVLEGTGMWWRGLIWEDDEAHECMRNHLNSIYTYIHP